MVTNTTLAGLGIGLLIMVGMVAIGGALRRRSRSVRIQHDPVSRRWLDEHRGHDVDY